MIELYDMADSLISCTLAYRDNERVDHELSGI